MTRVRYLDLAPEAADFKQEVIDALQQKPKRIAPKWFYDEEGSALFDQITTLEEYYPTRAEISILKKIALDWQEPIGTIIEYGSGNSEKVRLLLPKAKAYVAVDISGDHMYQACCKIARDFPKMAVKALCADYTQSLPLDELLKDCPKPWMIFYPGSSIGNFSKEEAVLILQHMRQSVSPGDSLLIGVDLIKDKTILEKAYNDRQGITAQFNKHLLKRISQAFCIPIDLDDFHHIAFYNNEEQRIEMHLLCHKAQIWDLDGIKIAVEQGERIHTENSYKYAPEQFFSILEGCEWQSKRRWHDEKNYFGVFYATA